LVKKKKEPIIYDGIKYDSEFEVLFAQWLKESSNHGYIEKAEYHPESYVLSPPVFRTCWKQDNKGKWKIGKEEVFGKVVYTLDWRITWSEKALNSGLIGILKADRRMNEFGLMAQKTKSGKYVSFIDVKPPVKTGGHNASYRDFAIKAPLIYQMNGHYLQSIVPINAKKPEDCFFSRTWAPKEYLFRPRKDGKGYLMNYCKQINIDNYEQSKLLSHL
jgi:hypothetical protein